VDTASTWIVALIGRVTETKPATAHFEAVQAQLAFAKQIFLGLMSVCAEKNGLAAESLVRTLFEVATNTIILAKRSTRLPLFVRHGRLTELRMLRFIQQPELKERLADLIKETDEEFQKLWEEFDARPWHNLKTKEALADAEFEAGMYDRYFRRASAIAHGQPYVTVRGGKVAARPVAWNNLSTGAANLGRLLMIFLIQIVNREFTLNLNAEIGALDAEVHKLINPHKKAILDAVDSQQKKVSESR
jgi:Family of unknown function (DUF5677)